MIHLLDTIFSLLSGYIYMWFARFGPEIDEELLHLTTSIIECYFAFSMYTNFVTDYLPDGSTEPIRDFKLIAKRYYNDDFKIHFIALLPITFFVHMN